MLYTNHLIQNNILSVKKRDEKVVAGQSGVSAGSKEMGGRKSWSMRVFLAGAWAFMSFVARHSQVPWLQVHQAPPPSSASVNTDET